VSDHAEASCRLALFARLPIPGRVKTRLVPRLGPDGAARLHRRMTEHTLARVAAGAREGAYTLEIRIEGGSVAEAATWLGAEFPIRLQGDGNLGDRLQRAMREAFAEGADRFAAIGADCPALEAEQVRRAFAALDTHDVALGPARDGGYWLAALRSDRPEIFEGIPWGTTHVAKRTLAAAAEASLTVHLLETLVDIDRPEDLPEWERATGEWLR